MHTLEARVGASQVDAAGLLQYGALLDLMQDCSGFQLDTEAGLNAYFRESKIGMYLASRQIELYRRPVYGECVQLFTSIYDCKRVYGYRNTWMLDTDGKVCAASYCIGVFIQLATGRPVRVPDAVIQSVSFAKPYPMPYLPHKLSLPDASAPWQQSAPVPVLSYQIDRYQHMNNARYLDVAAAFLPEECPSGRIRIAYRTPAKLGDMLYPRICRTAESCVISLTDADGKSYADMEFSQGEPPPQV